MKEIGIKVLAGSLIILTVFSCSEEKPQEKAEVVVEENTSLDPKEMLREAYQLFKEGNDEKSVELANEVLEIGRETQNDTLVGRALTSLCRNSQRKQDTIELAALSQQLVDLSKETGNEQWIMYMAHMNAEMYRLIGNMDKAETYYNQSLEISDRIGAKGMYTIDHFNKSFVSISKGDFESARELILKYYALRKEADPESEDAYGLIALAYYLEQQEDFVGAHEVATVTRRLFKEQNLFPEPPDEKPLIAVEEKVKSELNPVLMEEIEERSESETVNTLLEKYLD